MASFKQLEGATLGSRLVLSEMLDRLNFNADGLIPAIAQQADSGEVLMLAWMNRTSLEETLQTGQVCYWSRSRQQLWRKGESSGHRQRLQSLRIDCDGDALLLLVQQSGPACHTLRHNCFYWEVQGDALVMIQSPQVEHLS